MGYPAQIGMLWNMSDRVGIRPQIDWTRSSSESSTTIVTVVPIPGAPAITNTTTTSTQGWNLGIGAAALIYLVRDGALSTYLAPGFTYSRSTTTISGTSSIAGDRLPPSSTIAPTTTHSSNYTTSGVFGAQYTLATRFGLFGEVGVGYIHSGALPNLSALGSSNSTVQHDGSNWSVGIRSGVGVILFF